MVPCLCAPTSHKGSFRCRLHRAGDRRMAGEQDSWCRTDRKAPATVPCLCAPTSHPGSFRCRFHRTKEASWGGRPLRPSAHAKSLRHSDLAKSGDTVGLKKVAFARTNRASSEAKLRSELINKVIPEVVTAVEELRITPVEMYLLKTVRLEHVNNVE